MEQDPKGFRPPLYPPSAVLPRQASAFAQTPPAIFPVLLGLCGLALALRAGLAAVELSSGPADLLAGAAVGLWAFGVLAYAAKLARRPAVILDDLRVMPARMGLAAAGMGGMAAAGLLVPVAPGVAWVLLVGSLVLHGIIALLTVFVLVGLPRQGRAVNPGWHLTFVGFIVAAPAALALGREGLALVLFHATVPIAGAIWGISLSQLFRQPVPAPLRPLLAVHLSPLALFAIVATGTGQGAAALAFLVLLAVGLVILVLRSRWGVAAGFTPLWGAFTFPLAAAAKAFLVQGGGLAWIGGLLLAIALGLVPVIAWKVLRLWPGGQLAAKTNAARA